MGNIIINEVEYKNYGKCIEIANGIVDLLITTEVGPRIIRYGFVGEHNEFCDDAPLTFDVDGEDWRLMGGHRFWISPEEYPRTYIPDNDPIEYKITDTGAIVSKKADPWVQIERRYRSVFQRPGQKSV